MGWFNHQLDMYIDILSFLTKGVRVLHIPKKVVCSFAKFGRTWITAQFQVLKDVPGKIRINGAEMGEIPYL